MTIAFADRVREFTTSVGTGAINLEGTTGTFRAFSSAFSSGTQIYYCINDNTANWEVGIGTVTSGAPWTLSRDTVLSSSSGGALVNFGTGTKDVFSTYPAFEAQEVALGRDNDAPLAGFVNPENVTLSWSNATRTLTLTPISGSFNFYVNDVLFSKSTPQTVTIPNTTGSYYFYFDLTGTLLAGTAFNDDFILIYSFAAQVYWNATTGLAVPDALFEMHQSGVPTIIHNYLHHTRGAAYDTEIGGLLPVVTTEADGSLLSHIEIAASAGAIWDDAVQQIVGARLSTDVIPKLYRTGASGDWTFDESSSAAVLTAGTGRAAYNQFTGGVWQLTELVNNNFCLVHLFAIPGFTKKWMIILGQAQYSLIANARTAALTEITTITSIPFPEYIPVASLVVQTSDSYTNAVKSRFRSIDVGVDFIDWRTSLIGSPGTSGTGGDVFGPSSAIADNIVTFNGPSGKLVKDSGQSFATLTPRTSSTGSAALPAGTIAQRDAVPSVGYLRFNSDLGQFEGYGSGGWGKVGGGAVGGGLDAIFTENDSVASQNYTIGQSSFVPGVTVTIATPAVFTLNSHGFVAGSKITLATTSALPTGLSVNTVYYVISAGLTTDNFEVSLTEEGAAVDTSGSQSGVHSVSKVKNASVAGPLTVASGVTITVPTGSVLTIV